ncbi:cingulin-like protein 1 isoform X2 [Varanus komodoensis]|uniref:cingulin-like protein 1 isoform X2 n=1 Tax=Varanus komodoensis TaxID=61221 RepID=UPI001CF7D087|nr:cingulin-like protein 1 isoform X2 [Varanus komodoensis]
MESSFGSLRRVRRWQRDAEVPLQRLAREEAHVARSTPAAKPGSYGVSIRVQGIDGHPYIVLNNTEGGLSGNPPAPENGQEVASEPPGSPATGSGPASVTEEKAGEDGPFWDPFSAPPSVWRSLKQSRVDRGEDSASLCSSGLPGSSGLLNFQRHPELLQPYDPEKSLPGLAGLHPAPPSLHRCLADELGGDSESQVSPLEATASNKATLQCAELSKPKPKTVDLTKPAVTGDSGREGLEHPSATGSPNGLHGSLESLSSSSGSPCTGSPPGCLEARKCRPDLLPFRRQDSAGSVLSGSWRSSSSAAPTSAASLYRFLLDDQEYAIYADNVNRHENRRYIPFLPGTGRDIDTGSIPAVEQLIEKFGRRASPQRRGRLAIRSRVHPEDRKRSRSVDSALPSGLTGNGDCLDEGSKSLGVSSEHLPQPSGVCPPKPSPPDQTSAALVGSAAPRTVSKVRVMAGARDSPGNPFHSLQYHKQSKTTSESFVLRSSTLPTQNKKGENRTVTSTLLLPNRVVTQNISVKTRASASNAQVTPDLLEGQRELAQQTNEEAAKQILYSYLKEGSETDDATKRKVNLVFEKIQTLKSRAAGSTQASELSAELKALVEQKKELEKEVSELQRRLALEGRNQRNLREERDAARTELQGLRQQLEAGLEERDALQRQLEESEKELRHHLEELFQVKMEREQQQAEVRDLQGQLSEMHDELDGAKHVEQRGRELLLEELARLQGDLQALLAAREQQEEVHRKRERELTALKGALKADVSSHDQEMDRLKEQHGQELRVLRGALEEATKEVAALSRAQAEAEQLHSGAEERAREAAERAQQLEKALRELEGQQEALSWELEGLRRDRDSMEERMLFHQKEQQRVAEALAQAEAATEELAHAKATLEARLEAAQKDLQQLGQEQQQLADRLRDEVSQTDQLRRVKSELEAERRQLDKTIEKLHAEMAEIVEVSRASTLELQNQLDEYKEKNRRELAETQRQLKDKNLELEKACLTAIKLQEEVRFMGEQSRDHQRAQEESLTRTQLLEQTVKALEYELEAKNHLKEDRARQAKIMEEKISQLETELEEERNNSDVLSERIGRCREQMEQVRSELLQERAARQELECDKISLERQNKDLKSRILHLEGSYRSSKDGLLTQMEARILELEERLEAEERERANLQLTNRRLERRAKELLMQVDDEHLSLTDQKDQLSLRLKATKRQVEEAEEEIDRLESDKKKLQRELEDQVDLNEQLQGQLSAIRQELRRKKTSSKLLSDLDDDDDDFSTDGESLYEAPSGFKFLRDSDTKS